MPDDPTKQLIRYLTEAHGMERQALALLSKAADVVGDDDIARVYRRHRQETEEHERQVAARLAAHGASPSKAADVAMELGARGLGLAVQAAPDTPIRVATSTYALEHLEIAAYSLVAGLARRAGDTETVAAIERIVAQEREAAERIAGTFERVLEVTLGEPRVSPVASAEAAE